ncbi:MAG: (E)-4-hydroxy-3-methylbut-2-enyl-diphosphate synthase [Kosmotogales bacterium]|nr:(E)-4-hydroxy-3-methylbut-2-enyl-diphosphate synthase [Kosmotogales bacterium]
MGNSDRYRQIFMIKNVKIGNRVIGEDKDILVQSMTNTKTYDLESTTNQIRDLIENGCDIVRVSIPDFESVDSLKKITKKFSIPIVADIHFNYKLAIESIKAGAAKIRINPGNIEREWQLREIVKIAKDYKASIRVGSNSGSLNKDFSNMEPYIALGESALKQVSILEKYGFGDIVISAKSSSVTDNYNANKYIRERVNYPLHLGITESGFGDSGIIKSSIGIGMLLKEKIGETIRVSLSDTPVKEVKAGIDILKSLDLRKGVNIISCPTCARTEINVMELTRKVKEWTAEYDLLNREIKIAVMGCVVNGVGEGKNADIGIAGTKNGAIIFKNGRLINVKLDQIKDILKREIDNYFERNKK